MFHTLRWLIASGFLIALGCAPNQNGVWQPALPWYRQPTQTAGASNPWSQGGTATTPARPLFPRLAGQNGRINELMRRADEQGKLAASQRQQIQELQRLQTEQQQASRDYIIAQRTKERAALEKQFTDRESRLKSRYQQLQGRATDLDSNNRDLHAQLASSEQQRNLLTEEIDLLKQRLQETTQQLAQTRQVGLETDRQLRALQASATKRQGQAAISANSSVHRAITATTIPGLDIRQDNDLVRIRLPSEQLFMRDSATLHRGAVEALDRVAGALREYYPRQIVGIEAHAGIAGNRSHRLTMDQSMAVFEQLTARNLPPKQLFVIGHGGNQPIVSSGTTEGQAMNQRVEVVVYPEVFSY